MNIEFVSQLINGIIVDEFNQTNHSKAWYLARALEIAINFIQDAECKGDEKKEDMFNRIVEVFAAAEGISN